MQTEPETISPADYPADATAPSATDARIEVIPEGVPGTTREEQLASRDDVIARQAAEIAALHKQIATEKQIADEMEDAKRDWEDYKDRAKAAKERFDTLAEALAARVRGDVQTEVGEFSEAGGPKQT